ncbi:MAG: LacI family DNA-binding transcriptional regulator [Rhodobacteraceae bacterium]|nr:LacI family DNA-binding transcriptional regulator [Paracoccaceae bacterium]
MTDSEQPSHVPVEAPDPVARPTLKTIARLAGLAVPTVSRALGDAPDIGEETKRRVKEIAQQIGYRPNRAGVRLRTGRTNVLSLVMSTEHDQMNHTARLITAVAGALRGTPYHMIITPYFPDEDPMVPIRYIVETGSADGLILNQTEPEDPRVTYMMAHDFPFVTHGRTNICDRHSYVDFDNYAFAADAVAALARRGRRRIVLLAPPLTQSYSQHMLAGATEAAARLGVTVTLLADADAQDDSPRIARALSAALLGPEPPDGMISPRVGATMTMISTAEGFGRKLGRDFDMVAKEAIPVLESFRPGIIIVHEDIDHAGQFAARALMHRIAHPTEPPMQSLATPDPIDPPEGGQTVKP